MWIVFAAVSTKVTGALGTYVMTPAWVTSKARVKLSRSAVMAGFASSTITFEPGLLRLSQSATTQARSYGPGGQR